MRLILASGSPRRKELLRGLIPDFEVLPARGEEKTDFSRPPYEVVKALAAGKAREIAGLFAAADGAVLGADTAVAIDGEILGKPKDETDAFRMLSRLSGRTHEVFTGVCLIVPTKAGETVRVEYARTAVKFKTLSAEEIRAYIATGSPMDKAGAYGIQDGGLVEGIAGSYTNVVGLPTELCREMLSPYFSLKYIRKEERL